MCWRTAVLDYIGHLFGPDDDNAARIRVRWPRLLEIRLLTGLSIPTLYQIIVVSVSAVS